MTHLRVDQTELSYEVSLSSPISDVLDMRGKVACAIVSQFRDLNVELSDIDTDEGPLEDQGLSFEIGHLDATVLLRADRLEIHCPLMNETSKVAATELVDRTWSLMTGLSAGLMTDSHLVTFEIDCAVDGNTYGEILQTFCHAHPGLPHGTETAVVYYLPVDIGKGYLHSSLTLNRSTQVDGGVLIAAALVFDAKVVHGHDAIQIADARLQELLRTLGVNLLRE